LGSKLSRYRDWVMLLASIAAVAIAAIALVFSISNERLLAEVSLDQVAAGIRPAFEMSSPEIAYAGQPFTVSGVCSKRVPEGYSLWIVARAEDETYYVMHPSIDTSGSAWRHEGSVLAAAGGWQISVFLADANATNDLVGRAQRSDFRGFKNLPASMVAITDGERLEVRDSSED
jgi:hypothetical protein